MVPEVFEPFKFDCTLIHGILIVIQATRRLVWGKTGWRSRGTNSLPFGLNQHIIVLVRLFGASGGGGGERERDYLTFQLHDVRFDEIVFFWRIDLDKM